MGQTPGELRPRRASRPRPRRLCRRGSGHGTGLPANPIERNRPTIQDVVALFDPRNGRILALLDSAAVTALRTAATTAAAVRHLAHPDTNTVTLVGCGAQGRAHAEALFEILPRMRLLLHDAEAARAVDCARRIRDTFGRQTEVARDLRQAARASQVVVTCTPSTDPFLGEEDVAPGALVCAVGADNEQKAEIHVPRLRRARIVTDLTAQCAKIGDLRRAVEAGLEPGDLVRAEFSEIITGRRSARDHPDDIVVFDSTGLAIADLALGALILERAEALQPVGLRA